MGHKYECACGECRSWKREGFQTQAIPDHRRILVDSPPLPDIKNEPTRTRWILDYDLRKYRQVRQ